MIFSLSACNQDTIEAKISEKKLMHSQMQYFSNRFVFNDRVFCFRSYEIPGLKVKFTAHPIPVKNEPQSFAYLKIQ